MRLAPLQPPAPVPPFFWADWGVGEWGLAVIGIIIGVLALIVAIKGVRVAINVPWAIHHRESKQAQETEERAEQRALEQRKHDEQLRRRAEEQKERLAALRAILVDLAEVEKQLDPLSFAVLGAEAVELKDLKDAADRLVKSGSDPRLPSGARETVRSKISSIHGEADAVNGIPSPPSLQYALGAWKLSEDSDAVYDVIFDIVRKALWQRDHSERLRDYCRELREQIESLIKAAQSPS